jgi:PKD repeat protein
VKPEPFQLLSKKHRVMNRKILLALLGLIFTAGVSAQPLYTSHVIYTAQELVEDILITGCLEAMNVTYTGHPMSKGYFQTTATPSNFHFESGVVMASGYVSTAAGPNNAGSAGTNTNQPGDLNLSALIPQNTWDAAVLQFDFIPADNVIEFRYAFGSEEYLEYVNSSFNDVFAFLLTGPNPTGVNYVNQNIAVVPFTTIPVSINNVNNVANSTYYINNGTGASPGLEAVQYDGYTVAMTATANVTPCETYHIKLAVADGGDHILDSGVFLEAGSFSSGEVVSMTPYNHDGAESHEIYEGCENFYIFTRTDTTDMSDSIVVLLSLSGTASASSDITGFPLTFTIDTGIPSDTIFYSAILDNLAEGTEYLVFTLLNGCPCTVTGTNDTIWVHDNNTINAGIIQSDTLICSVPSVQPSVTLQAFSNTAVLITSYEWSTGEVTPTIVVQPTVGAVTSYSVTVTDECDQISIDDIDITVSDMDALVTTVTDLTCNNVCDGQVLINPVSGFAPYTYSWSPGNIGQATTGLAQGLCEGNYSVTVSDVFGCQATSSFYVGQPLAMYLEFDQVPATCPGASDGELEITVINGQIGSQSWFYYCSGQLPDSIESPPYTSYTFVNLPSASYTVNVVDGRGCLATGVYSIDEDELTYNTNITDVGCWSDSTGSANFSITGGTPPYEYEWSTGSLINSIANMPAGNYSCTVIDDHDCMILVPVTIDEPDRLILTNSLDTVMCLNEVVHLQAVAQGGTPSFTYNWYEDIDQYNLLFSGVLFEYSPEYTDTIYVMVEDQNNCITERNEVIININPDVAVNFYANIDAICKGESTYLYANVTGGNGGPYQIFDVDSNLLEFPLFVDPLSTTTYTVKAYDDCGSRVGIGEYTVQVMNPPAGQFYSEDSSGCAPLTVYFHETTPSAGQTYLWNFGDLNDNGYSLSKDPVHEFKDAGKYDIALTVTSEFGCETTVIEQQLIDVKPQPEADILPDPPSASILHPVVHFINATDSPLDTATIFFGDGNKLGLSADIFTDVQYFYEDTGIYIVQLIVENREGCIDTAYNEVEIYTEHDQMHAPNAFNPYSENPANQIFRPVGIGIDDNNYHLIIYDRWGAKVFETFNFDKGWDGRIRNGEVGSPGAYPWVAIYKDNYGKTHRVSGAVTIIY